MNISIPAGLKIGLGLVGVAVVGFLAYKGTKAVSAAADVVGQTVADAVDAVSPTNPDNVFATAVNKVGEAVSGDASWSLGGWIYDMTHSDPVTDWKPPVTKDTAVTHETVFDQMGNPIY